LDRGGAEDEDGPTAGAQWPSHADMREMHEARRQAGEKWRKVVAPRQRRRTHRGAHRCAFGHEAAEMERLSGYSLVGDGRAYKRKVVAGDERLPDSFEVQTRGAERKPAIREACFFR